MAHRNEKRKNEKGLALVIAVLITSALVAIGSFAMVMTNTELDISRNDRFSKETFYAADSSLPIYSRVIGEIFFNNTPTDIPGWDIDMDIDPTSPADATDVGLVREVMGLNRTLGDDADSGVGNELASNQEYGVAQGAEAEQNPDIKGSVGGKNLAIDIDWRANKVDPGWGVATHDGYEATGVKKDSRVYFDVRPVGTMPRISTQLHHVYKY